MDGFQKISGPPTPQSILGGMVVNVALAVLFFYYLFAVEADVVCYADDS